MVPRAAHSRLRFSLQTFIFTDGEDEALARRTGEPWTWGGEGRAIRRVSCAEVLVVARAGGGGGGEWDVMDSDFSFIHEEGRGPGRKAAEDQ